MRFHFEKYLPHVSGWNFGAPVVAGCGFSSLVFFSSYFFFILVHVSLFFFLENVLYVPGLMCIGFSIPRY